MHESLQATAGGNKGPEAWSPRDGQWGTGPFQNLEIEMGTKTHRTLNDSCMNLRRPQQEKQQKSILGASWDFLGLLGSMFGSTWTYF